MIKFARATSFAIALCVSSGPALARGGHGGGHSGGGHFGGSHSGSHLVHSYTRRDGTFVHAHEAGNPLSGNHWHLSADHTTDTLTRPDGSTETIPAPH